MPQALQAADLVFCFGQNEGKAALGWEPAVVLAALGPRLYAHQQLEALIAALSAQAQSGDHIVIMSNGGFADIHNKLLRALAAIQT